MNNLRKLLRFLDKHAAKLALAMSLLFGIAGSIISVIRYWQYEVFYFDFGLFDKAIWSVSRFSPPIIDHIALGEKIIFADHFSPSLFLLSPLFWIFPKSEMLLIVQALMVAASGFVFFLIAKHVLKNTYYAISLLLCYFLFVGLQNAVIIDFHEVTIATLAFMLVWYGAVKKNKKLYFVSLIVLLGYKESMFLLGIGTAFALFFLQPSWRKIAYITFAVSLAWGLISIKLLIPYFSGGTYFYSNELPSNPLLIIPALVDNQTKRDTLFYTFSSFGFLPLLNPAFWPLMLQDFIVRFYPANFPTRWGLGLHYSALIAAIMAVSSIYSLQFLQKRVKKKILIVLVAILVLHSLFLYRVVLRGPFALAYNPAFYAHTKDFVFLDEVIKRIPPDASVMTQNNLAPHFTHQKVWLLLASSKPDHPEYYSSKKPDYILIDNRDGQNPNNFFGVRDMNILLDNLQRDPEYMLDYKKDNLYIFKKRNQLFRTFLLQFP